MNKRSRDLDNLVPIDSSHESDDVTREVSAAVPEPVGAPCQYFRLRGGFHKKSCITLLREHLQEEENNDRNFGNI